MGDDQTIEIERGKTEILLLLNPDTLFRLKRFIKIQKNRHDASLLLY